jgi:NADPH:quinone reductase-like Zn-dependent oxidoreductase/malonyl CoA-acyl carrier protein transacylase/acyl carrier protein
MGARLLQEAPIFRKAIREIDVFFRRCAGYSLEEELAGKNGADYELTERAQPALFALQVGVTQMLRHRGVAPAAVAGHSVGEVAAAWASGVLTLEAAVEVIYHRSRLQARTKGKGAMTAVGVGETAARNLLEELGLAPELVLAGINSSRGVTIAGNPALLTRLESTLVQREIIHKRLDLDYAFHGPAMDEIEAEVRQVLAKVRPGPSLVPFYSTVTGTLLEGRQLDAEYWWHNIRKPVLFEQAIRRVQTGGVNIFIEVGPHPILRSYINDCLKESKTEGRIIPTLARGDDAPQRVWGACGQALIAGGRIDWQPFFPFPGKVMQLPNYPWQRERHWHPVTPESMGLLDRHKVHPLLGYSLKQHELSWENQLDTTLNPIFADHVVGEAIVFPGTGFSELVLAAAFAWHSGDLAEIEELEIRSPLLLSDDHSQLIQVCIEALDGGVTIKAREYASTESWTQHAVGRILREPSDLLLRQQLPELPTRQPDFDGTSHGVLTQAAGLTYGPAFQCIDYGWVEKDSVLTVFKIPPSIEAELEQMHLHPALLDCTFQLIIQLLKEEVGLIDGVTFVPIKMGRIAFRDSQATPAFARATLLRRTAHALTAEFTVFDLDGVALAVVKEARFRSIRLGKNAADRLRFLDYHAIPKPHPLRPEGAPIIAFKRVQSVLVDLAERAAREGSHRRYAEEVDPLLDSLCNQFTREALQQLSAGGKKLSSEKILACTTNNPEIEPFLEHLLSSAKEDQSIARIPDGWDILPELEAQASAQDIWNSLVADYPDFFQIVHAVGRIGMHLASLLEGGLTLPQIRPQDSSLARLTGQVLGAGGKQKIGQALRDLIAQGMDQLPEGRRLGIVEISESSPFFALDCCVALDFNCCDYVFASTSSVLLEETVQLKERFPFIDTRLIDDASEPSEAAPICQLGIVTLDFTTLEDAIRAMHYARTCLAPGGSLIVIGQHPARWIDFVFGAQANHWLLSKNRTWLSNQRPSSFWQQQLQQLGFFCSDIHELSPNAFSGPYLLPARVTEEALPAAASCKTLPRSWVLLADQNGISAQLSDHLTKKLQARGDLVVQASPGDTAHLTSLLQETTTCYGQLDGIVYLAGLLPQRTQAEAEIVFDQQVARCATAASIIQACEETQTKTTCWLITTGAAVDLLPHGGPGKNAEPILFAGDAALWGFGRTLINEPSNATIRLIDLEDPAPIETVAIALEKEFEQPDKEQEIILNAQGERYAPRLRLEPRPDEQENTGPEIDTPTISLGFQFPGRLRNLRWEALPRTTPAVDEVEIEVHATGLNFRDIMYTLGLLPDEAIENGFAGPTLGLEFSGIVRSVGSTTCAFAPGDQVVGFGPSCFSNRVVTQASAIVHLPPGISFEAAVTIPCTFFTVYYALRHLARLQPGEKILIHGAAGGVGLAAIQLAKWMGAEIYATAGSDEKRDFLRLLGVEHIFNSRTLAFADEIMTQTEGRGVDVVLNSLAGEAINRNFQVLKPFGRFLELGKRDFYENTKIGLRPFRNNISYFGIDTDQLMQSHPDLTRSLFAEVMALFAEGELHPLPYHVFEASNVVDAFRYMQQARQIGKIVIAYQNGISPVHTPRPSIRKNLVLPAHASYLVTGGLGGFGLRTAQWLVSKGARNLILISRSGPASEEAKEALARMQEQGVKVHAASCDITDKEALSALLVDTAATFPPLRGIVHAAAVINDGLIRNMDAAQIRSVLAPKALGAYHLHAMTLGTPLDFFILFSSATTLFGNPGQGNYVAANMALEALAKKRRAAGLAATCVRWGAIEDVGFLARNEHIKDALQSRMGGSALHSILALDILERMLVADRSSLGIMELDWKALARFLPSANTPKFSELAQHASDSDGGEDSAETIQRMLEELSEADLLTALIEILKKEVGEILRISPDKIDPTRSLYDMGLDSLMGVELVVALESRFGTRLPVMTLSQNPTIAKLGEQIVRQLKAGDAIDAAADDNEMLAQVEQLALQHGAEASAEAIANLASDLQSPDADSDGRIISDRL